MGTANRLTWMAKGSPFRLMRPAAALRDRLRAYGYTVYDIGNETHLDHVPPEDHTPYSATGWPGTAVYGVGYAIDIMPPPVGSWLPSLQQLGTRLLMDRRNGVRSASWIKYMNWEPGDRNCWHESWQPTYRRTTSTDRGHIHLSGVTGLEDSAIGDDYDPVALIRGITSSKGAIMTALTDEQQQQLYTWVKDISYILWSGGRKPDGSRGDIREELYTIQRAIAALPQGDQLGVQAIAAAVLAGLTPERIAAAIPADIAQQVVDQLAARLNKS